MKKSLQIDLIPQTFDKKIIPSLESENDSIMIDLKPKSKLRNIKMDLDTEKIEFSKKIDNSNKRLNKSDLDERTKLDNHPNIIIKSLLNFMEGCNNVSDHSYIW